MSPVERSSSATCRFRRGILASCKIRQTAISYWFISLLDSTGFYIASVSEDILWLMQPADRATLFPFGLALFRGQWQFGFHRMAAAADVNDGCSIFLHFQFLSQMMFKTIIMAPAVKAQAAADRIAGIRLAAAGAKIRGEWGVVFFSGWSWSGFMLWQVGDAQ